MHLSHLNTYLTSKCSFPAAFEISRSNAEALAGSSFSNSFRDTTVGELKKIILKIFPVCNRIHQNGESCPDLESTCEKIASADNFKKTGLADKLLTEQIILLSRADIPELLSLITLNLAMKILPSAKEECRHNALEKIFGYISRLSIAPEAALKIIFKEQASIGMEFYPHFAEALILSPHERIYEENKIRTRLAMEEAFFNHLNGLILGTLAGNAAAIGKLNSIIQHLGALEIKTDSEGIEITDLDPQAFYQCLYTRGQSLDFSAATLMIAAGFNAQLQLFELISRSSADFVASNPFFSFGAAVGIGACLTERPEAQQALAKILATKFQPEPLDLQIKKAAYWAQARLAECS